MGTMFDRKAYLRCLGCDSDLEPTIQTLRMIHRAHLERFPFDNTEELATDEIPESRINDAARIFENDEVVAGKIVPVSIDIDLAYRKVVAQRRGGICGELNALFFRLLRELGFEAKFVYGGVRLASGGYGPDFFHILIVVTINSTRWLVDVGFPSFSFLDPLELILGEEQVQDGCQFRIVEQGYYLTVERKSRVQDWLPLYRFSENGPRELIAWQESEEFRAKAAASSPGLHINMRRRALSGGGQLVMMGDYLLRVTDGHEEVSRLTDDFERHNAVAEIMGIPDC
jgi:amide synthase